MTLDSVEYQILVQPKDDGYVFAMVSLQPVGDAMESLRSFAGLFFAASLQGQIDGMTELVAEMLELSKMESGAYRLQTEPFDVQEALRGACRPFRELCMEKECRLTLQAPDLMALGSSRLIVRVISNFLSNAVRHTPEGGIIRVSADGCGETVTVRVENQGEPLPEEARKRVFEQFYRVRPETGGGSGLGLAICKAILELHGAAYGVENTDIGVCFFFTLPAVPQEI